MGTLPLLSPEGASTAALLLFRITGVVWIAPVLSARAFTTRAKSGLVALLVILLWPVAMASGPATITAEAVFSELLIGVTIGFAATIFIAAAEMAGDMVAVQMGLSGANVLDPMSSTQMPVLGQFLGLFTTALLVSIGGHVLVLETLGASVDRIPLGAPIDVAGGFAGVVELGAAMLALGLRFAAPAIAAMMIGNAALGILARTVPQMNLLMVAFPVQIAIGLFTVAASLPLIATTFGTWPSVYAALTEGVLFDLVPMVRP